MKSNTNKPGHKDTPRLRSGQARTQGHTLLRYKATRIILVALCLGAVVTFVMLVSAPKQRVSIKKLKNSNYQLLVNGQPYIVKGVCYNPVSIGKSYDYDWWSDPAKPWMVDGKLMQGMGVNTIRLYQAHEDTKEVKAVISGMLNLYGIRTALGSWLGFWEYPCPFYADKKFQAKVKNEFLDMVKLYKDQPGILMWILGNENNYSCTGKVNPWSSEEIDKETDPQKRKDMRFRIYYSFLNEIAKEVHKIDPNHPVVLGNGELIGLDIAKEVCPDIDIVGCIIYRGKSFGNIFTNLKKTFDRPILLVEFGADAYDAVGKKENQQHQAYFLQAQWRQIYNNLAGKKEGAGNCIGGVMFEWSDEWWKHNESDPLGWKIHDTEAGWSNGSYYFDAAAGKNMDEEWFGLVSLSEEMENGLNKRNPRKSYYVIREFWKNPKLKEEKKK